MFIKKRILRYNSDPECGHAYRGPLLGFVSKKVKFFICISEWNERCVIGKISQSYTNSRLTSVARYGFQKLQNRLIRNRRKKLKIAENIHSVRMVENIGKWEFEWYLEE